MSTVPDPSRFIDLHFTIKKISWSLYEVDDRQNIKGIARLLAIPTNIFEVPREFLPPRMQPPVIALNTQGVVAFSNEGKKGPPSPHLSPEESSKAPQEDLTSYVTTRDEPFNEYIVSRRGGTPLLVRTKTVLIKLVVLKNRYNIFGDPVIRIEHNTSHSVSEYKEGELYSP